MIYWRGCTRECVSTRKYPTIAWKVFGNVSVRGFRYCSKGSESHSIIQVRVTFRSFESKLHGVLAVASLTSSWRCISASEANSCAANEDIPNTLWNPKAHCHGHKNTPLVRIPNEMNPVHTPTPPYLSSKIPLNISGVIIVNGCAV
jgi:hypothetical protein